VPLVALVGLPKSSTKPVPDQYRSSTVEEPSKAVVVPSIFR